MYFVSAIVLVKRVKTNVKAEIMDKKMQNIFQKPWGMMYVSF
jgi:hypothetical protein